MGPQRLQMTILIFAACFVLKCSCCKFFWFYASATFNPTGASPLGYHSHVHDYVHVCKYFTMTQLPMTQPPMTQPLFNSSSTLRQDTEGLQAAVHLSRFLDWNSNTPVTGWICVTVGPTHRIKNLTFYDKLFGDKGLEGLRLPNSLLSLTFDHNCITDKGYQRLVLPGSLKTLHLGRNLITARGLHHVDLPSRLRTLSLDRINLSNLLTNPLDLPRFLVNLTINSCNLNAGAVVFLKLPPTLQVLDLTKNNIGDDGVKKMLLPPTLGILNLSSNSIGSNGAGFLRLPPSLRRLVLAHNNIGPLGAHRIVLPFLWSLDLHDNNIGDDGMMGLKLPPSIVNFSAYDNNLTRVGDALRLWPYDALKQNYINSMSENDTSRYFPVSQYFKFQMWLPLRMELLRAVRQGCSAHPIISFLASIPGSAHIHSLILSYFNPNCGEME